jgi:hypothetical protein
MAKKPKPKPIVGRLGPPTNLRPGGAHKSDKRTELEKLEREEAKESVT